MPNMQTMPIVHTMPFLTATQCQICTQCHLCSTFGIRWLHIWHCMGAQLALCVFTIWLVTHETLGLVWSLGWRLVWFGHSGDAWSGLVTWVTLGLVWSLRRRLSDLTHSGGVRGCVMIIFKTLSGFDYSGDVVWFDPLGGRGVPVTSLRRRNQTLTWLSLPFLLKLNRATDTSSEL